MDINCHSKYVFADVVERRMTIRLVQYACHVTLHGDRRHKDVTTNVITAEGVVEASLVLHLSQFGHSASKDEGWKDYFYIKYLFYKLIHYNFIIVTIL